jgi:hypothetical protein
MLYYANHLVFIDKLDAFAPSSSSCSSAWREGTQCPFVNTLSCNGIRVLTNADNNPGRHRSAL